MNKSNIGMRLLISKVTDWVSLCGIQAVYGLSLLVSCFNATIGDLSSKIKDIFEIIGKEFVNGRQRPIEWEETRAIGIERDRDTAREMKIAKEIKRGRGRRGMKRRKKRLNTTKKLMIRTDEISLLSTQTKLQAEKRARKKKHGNLVMLNPLTQTTWN